MKALETLRAARALIADPARWTRSAPARIADGRPCHALHRRATRWCAAGALSRVASRRRDAPGVDQLEAVARELFGLDVGRANDRGTHDQVLAMFDTAIARLELTSVRHVPG